MRGRRGRCVAGELHKGTPSADNPPSIDLPRPFERTPSLAQCSALYYSISHCCHCYYYDSLPLSIVGWRCGGAFSRPAFSLGTGSATLARFVAENTLSTRKFRQFCAFDVLRDARALTDDGLWSCDTSQLIVKVKTIG